MKTIKFTLILHTPWSKFPSKENLDNATDEKFIEIIKNFSEEYHLFKCGNLCNIFINNNNQIKIDFLHDETNETNVRELIMIIVYYVSILNGYNCKLENNCEIDNNLIENFFNFPKEDESNFSVFKDIKFYEISLESIKNDFGNHIFNLYSNPNRKFILTLLSNYYSTVFYKDFFGNLEFEFRNTIVNLESIISIIKKEDYKNIKEENKEKMKKFGGKNLKSCAAPINISLKDKLQDLFKLFESLFNVEFKKNLNKECEKIANTRNFISHLFEDQKECLNDNEISMYNNVLPDVFRMLFLYYLNLDKNFIKISFFKNQIIRRKMLTIFNMK